MAKKPLPSPETLRQLLRYEPGTGKMFWLPRTVEMFAPGNTSSEANCSAWNKRYSGKEAFTAVNVHGYLHGAIFCNTISAHKVAWALHFGEWHNLYIDHRNGDKTDNRIKNLRESTPSQNSCNRGVPSDNKSGVKGVCWDKSRGLWKVQVRLNRVNHNIGRYSCIKEAHQAYRKHAEILHGSFVNHQHL